MRHGTPKSPPTKRRWLRYGVVVGLLLLLVVIYETGRQLDRPRAGADAAPDARAGLRALESHYRSHDLPAGWEVGEIARDDTGAIALSLHFAPGIASGRHGQAARPGEIGPENACPTLDSGLWEKLPARAFRIAVSDRTGTIDRIECRAPGGAG